MAVLFGMFPLEKMIDYKFLLAQQGRDQSAADKTKAKQTTKRLKPN